MIYLANLHYSLRGTQNLNESLPLVLFLITVIPVTGLIILQKIMVLRREKHPIKREKRK